ncbi:MAG: acyltransferase family protein [Syntrophorhabdaceae bacterium]
MASVWKEGIAREDGEPGRQNTARRYDFLDYFRGMMIVCMLFNHSAKFLWVSPEKGLYIRSFLWLDYFIAANFLLISGFAYNYYRQARKDTVVRRSLYLKESMVRAVLIYGIATIMSVLFGKFGGLDDSWSHWSIFKIIGIGMIVILLLESFSHANAWLALAMGGFFFLGYASTIMDSALLDFFSKRAFAFFPWFNFYGSGFLIGKFLITFKETGLDVTRLRRMALPALLLAALFVTPLLIGNWSTYLEEQGKLYLGNVGLFVCFLATFHYLTGKRSREKLAWATRQVIRFGRISFSLYYIHFALIFAASMISASVSGRDHLNEWVFTSIVAILLGLMVFICFLWEKLSYVMSIEWFMRRIINMSLKK